MGGFKKIYLALRSFTANHLLRLFVVACAARAGFVAAYLFCGLVGQRILVLDEDEAVLRYKGLIFNTVANR